MAIQTTNTDLYDSTFAFVSRHGLPLLDLLDPMPGERILDLGCGTGTLLRDIVQRGAVGIGLDADPAMVEAARAALDGTPIIHADAASFELPEAVDAVFSNAVLHWIADQDAVTASVFAALKPGGRFVAEQGGARNTEIVDDGLRVAFEEHGYDLPPRWYYPTPAEHAAVLERAGFRVAMIEHFPRETRLDGGSSGLHSWLTMFGMSLFEDVAARDVDPILRRVDDLLRPRLFRDEAWVVDYWRLRFVAIRE